MLSRALLAMPTVVVFLVSAIMLTLAYCEDIHSVSLPTTSSLPLLETGETVYLSVGMPMQGRKGGKGKGDQMPI